MSTEMLELSVALWQVVPEKDEQSELELHPGKQMSSLLALVTHQLGWPAEVQPQSPELLQLLVHHAPLQVPWLQSEFEEQGSPIFPPEGFFDSQ